MLRSMVTRVLKAFNKDSNTLQLDIYEELERVKLTEQINFPGEIIVPQGYGKGMPERVVELLLAGLSYTPGKRVLDVGHANAMKCHLDLLQSLAQPKNITGIDIATPVYDTRFYYEQSIIGDITCTSFTDNSFDLIWCISALEHFGMDNSGYTDNFRRDSDMDIQAVKEMLRILAKGGNMLITVPYGKYEDNGWFRNYDKSHLQGLLDVARLHGDVREWYFRHTNDKGWSITTPAELQYTSYYDCANHGAAGVAAIYITKNSS